MISGGFSAKLDDVRNADAEAFGGRRNANPARSGIRRGLCRRLRGQSWNGYAGNAQHTALSVAGSQPLQAVHWSTPVDLNPQLSGSDLLIHYGSPVITPGDTVIVPVKTGASSGFELNAYNGSTGSLMWTQSTDYALAAPKWRRLFVDTALLTGDVERDDLLCRGWRDDL